MNWTIILVILIAGFLIFRLAIILCFLNDADHTIDVFFYV